MKEPTRRDDRVILIESYEDTSTEALDMTEDESEFS